MSGSMVIGSIGLVGTYLYMGYNWGEINQWIRSPFDPNFQQDIQVKETLLRSTEVGVSAFPRHLGWFFLAQGFTTHNQS